MARIIYVAVVVLAILILVGKKNTTALSAELVDLIGEAGRGPAGPAPQGPGVTRPLPLPVRIAVAVTVTAVVLVVRLLVGAGRLGLWLLALAGFRGARLPALAATGIGVGGRPGRSGCARRSGWR